MDGESAFFFFNNFFLGGGNREAIYPPWTLGPHLRFSWRLEALARRSHEAPPGCTALHLKDL